ncbi:MAG: hypothetical protein U0894_05745 [Pirellulales bacterium]
MADIKSPTLLYLKGAMFLAIGLLAAGGILLEHPSWKVAVLLDFDLGLFPGLLLCVLCDSALRRPPV